MQIFFSELSVITFRLSQAEKCLHPPQKHGPRPLGPLLTCVLYPFLTSTPSPTPTLSDSLYIPSSKISHPWKDGLHQSPASVKAEGPLTHLPLRTPPSLLQKTPGSFLCPLFRHFLHCPCQMKIKGESESWEGWQAGGGVPSLLSGQQGGSSHIRVWKFHCSFLIPAALVHFHPPPPSSWTLPAIHSISK